MKIRRVLAALMILVMILSFTACGTDDISADTGQRYETAIENFVIPEYEGLPYAYVNGNIPYFTEEELAESEIFESYSELDYLGRAGTAYANLGPELLPTEERESISEVRPSGWDQEFYDFMDGEALFNRSHLIAFSLAGENANEKNLITGTRTMNQIAMQQFEIMTVQYIEETGNNVLYRVTPVYEGENLVASGVIMEGYSPVDKGYGICFNVYCFNIEPGVEIDYATGESWENESTLINEYDADYVLNGNNGKFHYTYCENAESMSESNKIYLSVDRETMIENGYVPAGCCNP
ncbi:MAG: hypothetical protein E7225_01935 [Clostridiales bacterium]|nr:hypothetical protein [Clostridiales bacterium]